MSTESEEGRNTRNIWLIGCLVCSTQTEALETYDKGEGVIMSNFQFFFEMGTKLYKLSHDVNDNAQSLVFLP